jgi:hypothetical protein
MVAARRAARHGPETTAVVGVSPPAPAGAAQPTSPSEAVPTGKPRSSSRIRRTDSLGTGEMAGRTAEPSFSSSRIGKALFKNTS